MLVGAPGNYSEVLAWRGWQLAQVAVGELAMTSRVVAQELELKYLENEGGLELSFIRDLGA